MKEKIVKLTLMNAQSVDHAEMEVLVKTWKMITFANVNPVSKGITRFLFINRFE